MPENNVARNSIEYLQRQHDECSSAVKDRLMHLEGTMNKIYGMFAGILTGIILILVQLIFKPL